MFKFLMGTALIGLSVTLLPGIAQATTCPNGASSTTECDGDAVNTLINICRDDVTGYDIYCHLEANASGATSTQSSYYSPSSTEFVAWGTDAGGNDFCCEYTVSNGCTGTPLVIELNGSAGEDEMVLQYTPTSLDLDCSTTTVYGGAEHDTLVGSDSQDNDDILHGGTGSDVLMGHDGDDELYGEVGVDRIYGKEGTDYIEGGDHVDYVKGGDHVDTIFGRDGNDHLCGEGGVDLIYGEGSDDHLQR